MAYTGENKPVYNRNKFIRNEIKTMLTMEDVLDRYYTEKRHNGKVCCPFHDDHTPSMMYKGGRYHCFTCGMGGDVIDFVQTYFELSFIDTLKKIDADFGLHLYGVDELTSEQEATLTQREAKRIAEREQQQRVNEQYNNLLDEIAHLEIILDHTRPKADATPEEVSDYAALMAQYDAKIYELNDSELEQYIARQAKRSEMPKQTTQEVAPEDKVQQPELKAEKGIIVTVDVVSAAHEKVSSANGSSLLARGNVNVNNGDLTFEVMYWQSARGTPFVAYPHYLTVKNNNKEIHDFIYPRSDEVRSDITDAVKAAYEKKETARVVLTTTDTDVTLKSFRSIPQSNTSKKGTGSINIGNAFTVTAIKLVQLPSGATFSSPPTLTPTRNANGELVYRNAVEFSKSLQAKVSELMSAAYKKEAAKQTEVMEQNDPYAGAMERYMSDEPISRISAPQMPSMPYFPELNPK